MQEFIGLLGYILALVTTVIAWVLWRKQTDVQAQIDTVMRSRDELALAAKDVRNELEQFKDRLEKSQAESRKLRDQLQREKAEVKTAVFERSKAFEESEQARAKAERRADNFESQCESLLKQLRSAEELRLAAERRYDELSQDFDRKVQSAREAAEGRNAQLRNDLAQIRGEFEGLKARARQLDELTKLASPEDVKRLKRKVTNLEHLLMSMRGLKEMAEERSQNWEIALRILSHAVLKERGRVAPGGPDQLGSLVGAALEACGDALVRDEWTIGSTDTRGPQADASASVT